MRARSEDFYVYIITDEKRTLLEIGLTTALSVRLQHLQNEPDAYKALDSHPDCKYIVYWETFQDASAAVKREESIKRWSNKKKRALVSTRNPEWQFFNEDVFAMH